MPKIPTYQRQVGLETPNIPDAPSAPSIDQSGALQGMRRMAQADLGTAEAIGDIGQMLAKHAIQKQKEIDDADISARESAFRMEMQDALYNKDIEKVKVNGQDIERPKGLAVREMDMADGASVEWRERYGKMKQKYLSGLRTREQFNKLNQTMDGYFVSTDGMIVKHEAEQFRKSLTNKHEMNAKQIKAEAAGIADKDTLLNNIKRLNEVYGHISSVQGVTDPGVIRFNQMTNAGDAVQNSVVSYLRNTGDLKGAETLLDEVKDSILPDKYSDIKEELKTSKRAIDKLAKEQLNLQKDELYTKLFDGSLTLQEIAAVNKPIEQGGIGGKAAIDLKNKLIKAQNAELKDITADSSSAERYVQLVDNLISNQETSFDAKKIMVDAYADGIISGDEAKKMEDVSKILKDMKFNKQSSILINSLKTVKSWFGANNPDDKALATALRKIIYADVATKDQAEAAAITQDIIRQEQITRNPKLGLLPDLPNQTMTTDGRIENNMPGLRNLKADIRVNKGVGVLKQDPITGVKARVYPDGTYDIISE